MSCKYFHPVNTITVATNLELSFTTSPTVRNETRFCFKIFDDVPATGSALPVTISVNGVQVPVWNKYGNPMLGADLNKCKVYKGWYTSTAPAHVIVSNEPMERW